MISRNPIEREALALTISPAEAASRGVSSTSLICTSPQKIPFAEATCPCKHTRPSLITLDITDNIQIMAINVECQSEIVHNLVDTGLTPKQLLMLVIYMPANLSGKLRLGKKRPANRLVRILPVTSAVCDSWSMSRTLAARKSLESSRRLASQRTKLLRLLNSSPREADGLSS